MVKGDWVKPGATVIDVGINRVAAPEKGEGKTRLVGDVDFAERLRRGRHHAGAGRRRADDHRHADGQHAGSASVLAAGLDGPEFLTALIPGLRENEGLTTLAAPPILIALDFAVPDPGR
jgi:hypothetical protein